VDRRVGLNRAVITIVVVRALLSVTGPVLAARRRG